MNVESSEDDKYCLYKLNNTKCIISDTQYSTAVEYFTMKTEMKYYVRQVIINEKQI